MSYKLTEKSFWLRVAIRYDQCWPWLRAKTSKGYGTVWDGKRNLSAHRVAYQFAVGEIPDGMHVLHHCDLPACCNPDHLFLGTNADNVADRVKKRRSSGGRFPGELAPHAKLTADNAKQIRELCAAGFSQREIAQRFNVHFGTVNDLVLRKTWRHI